MTNTMRKSALATTALGMMLALPSVAAAQETCIQVVGTISTQTQDAATDGQANALIVTAGAGEEGATCVESLDELTAMLGDSAVLAEGLAAVEPAAGAAGGDAAAAPEGESTVEAAPETEGEAVEPLPDEEAAADDSATETDEAMTAEGEGAAEEEMTAESEATAEEEMTAEAEVVEPTGNAREMLVGLTVGEVVGMDILSPEGEDIGTVEDVVADEQENVYVVASLDDGALGIGDSERVINLDHLNYSSEEESLVLVELSVEWLETLPEFDADTSNYLDIAEDAPF